MTRRTLLGGMAAAGVASLARPVAGLSAALDPARCVFSRWVGSVSGYSSPIDAPRPFALVGVEWAGARGARIELRSRAREGRWGRWGLASSAGHDPDGRIADGGLFGEPMWTGPADQVQLRALQPIRGVRLHFVAPPPARDYARAAAGFPLARPVLEAGPGQPPIIARQAWAQGQAPPGHAPVYATIQLAFVHHTVNPNGYAAADVPSLLLGIFQYHRYVRGYWDIAYNFLIDLYGRVWEGRAGGIDSPVMGAHAGGYNAESTGVAVLGDFMDVVPSPAAIGALERFLAWKLSLHGVPTDGDVTVVVDPADAYYTPFAPGAHVSLPRIAGHRDGDLTDCPGNAFYARLPSIRPHVDTLAGTPLRATINVPAAVAVAGSMIELQGRLHALGSGLGIAGAPIEVQWLRGGRRLTLATTTTAADGSWSAPVSPDINVLLRALHGPSPATVTDWIAVAIEPLITVAVTGTGPLEVSGSVAPAKAAVTVELRSAGRVVRRRRIAVSAGRFAAAIRAPKPGLYTLVARTAADAGNAPGASPPVAVTVT